MNRADKRHRFSVRVSRALLFASILFFPAASHSQTIDMNAFRAKENLQWGVRAFHNGSLNQAVMYFEKAITYKPENTEERVWLGLSLYKSGLEEIALSEWNGVLRKGKGSNLLQSKVQVVSARRGLVRDLFEENKYVLSSVIDASRKNYIKFARPTSVRARPDGSVYIVAFGTNEIILVDSNNTVIDVYRGGLEGFDHPFDVLDTGRGTLFVSEFEGNRITKCDARGNKLKSFGKKGTKDGELLGPQFLASDASGYVYVTDYGNKRISKYDPDGNFILSFGRKNADYAGIGGPTGIGVNGGKVYVCDSAGKKIDVFDTSGNYLTSLGSGFLKGPEGIMFISGRTLYVADSEPFAASTRIAKLDLENEKWEVFTDLGGQAKKLTSLTVDANGDLYACDYNLNKVFIVSEVSDLYSGLFVQVEKIDANNFPEVIVDVSCEDRFGNPVLGLQAANFVVSESLVPVSGQTMYEPVNKTNRAKIVVLVEKSAKSEKYDKEIAEAAKRIIELAGNPADVMIVTASDSPVIDSGTGGTLLTKLESLEAGAYSENWRFDLGARLAVSNLLQFRTKRAIIFLTEGTLEEGRHFDDYSLSETLQYMKNNFVSFNVVSFGTGEPGEDLRYIADGTRGSTYSYRQPKGIEGIVTDIRGKTDPRYAFKYKSSADTGFGEKLIPLSVEVRFRARSGRDESGYFGPIK